MSLQDNRLDHAKLAAFSQAVTPHLAGQLRTDALYCTLYATDASIYQIQPLAVLIPKTIEDVRLAVREAIAQALPIVARGGGSALAGQTVGKGLIIDFSVHLNQVLAFNPEEKWVEVQAGMVLEQLNLFLKAYGLKVGPDPASANRATLGGMVANNATGTHSILYGSVVDHLLEATVLLADGHEARFKPVSPDVWREKACLPNFEGQIYQGLDKLLSAHKAIIEQDTPQHWRRQGGYRVERLLSTPRNLASLLCGSEGTLGLVTSLKIGLVDVPKHTGLGIVHFTRRMEALEAVPALLETKPTAIELLDHHALDRCRAVQDFSDKLGFVVGRPEALQMVEFYGDTEAEIEAQFDVLAQQVERLQASFSIPALTFARSSAEKEAVRSVRKAGLGLVMGVKGDAKPIPFIEDAAVPVAHLAEYIARLEAVLAECGTEAVVYAHASAGCLHVRPFINLKQADGLQKMKRIAEASAALVKSYGGVISSEHGDGLVRAWLGESFYGKALYEAYRQIKQIFDPQGIFNPHKIVDAPPMTANLRLSPESKPLPLVEALDFIEDGSFMQAIEQCNGAGACRKMQGGTMCPSYRVTQDELHSTRGRANALRAAMQGQLPLTGGELKTAMELCISCKACKSECPSSVDMAKLKLEWQVHHWQANRPPLRDRFFAHLPKFAPLLSGSLAKLTNWTAAQVPQTWLGIHAARRLPLFTSKPFRAPRPKASSTAPQVVLYVDTFHRFFHPEVAYAAYDVLEKMGFSVQVPPYACCGRTYLSKGFLPEARQKALEVLATLTPYLDQNLPIIGLEPSCILSLWDEYPALFPKIEAIQMLKKQSFTFEGFLVQHLERLTEALTQKTVQMTAQKTYLVHGHCHQKALEGMATMRVLWACLPHAEVQLVDAGCCGMAGAFGYEAEHYTHSIEMAGLKLVPEILKTVPQTNVIASGTSCRAQIVHTTQRSAKHPAEVWASVL